MADMEEKRSLTDKKPSEMTTEDIMAMIKPVGLPGLPYPMANISRNKGGVIERDVWLVESKNNPLVVYTERGLEEVNGKLFREMPIPGMMLMLRELLTRMGPQADNRIMAVFGDAAFGKSHLFKLVGDLVHPKGAIVVDCGGMNMRELFFRTVIDYGKGVKEQLEQRVNGGKIKEANLNLLEETFPGAVIKKEGKAFLNWSAIGQRKTETVDGKTSTIESYEEASSRASKVLNLIYEDEGISVQHNAFGIKTVKGEIFESIESGRPIFLDEFNKSKKGTLDSFQTFLELANGQKSQAVIQNTMATDGDDDSPKSITVRREDLAVNWFFGIAGNDATDGDTTQELSTSMETRLDIMRVGKPTEIDWAHRISQVYTGLPLSTLYNLFEGTAKSNPAEFAQFLVDLRELGLTAEERKAIPPHERYLLKNFQDTVVAINQAAKCYDMQLKLADPESELFNQSAYENMVDEVAANAKRMHVSFRTVIDDRNKALQRAVDVRPAKEATLSLNLKDVFRNVDLQEVGKGNPGWYSLGRNLVQVLMERIANSTIGMPNTAAALMTLHEENGFFPPNYKEAKRSNSIKSVADLLKYDPLKDVGGTEELRELRSLLMAGLRSRYPDIQSSEDAVIPLEKLGVAVKEMAEKRVDTPKSFILPNDDLNTVNGAPLIDGRALPRYALDEAAANERELVLADFRTVLAALALPDYAEKNRARIWPVDIEKYTRRPEGADEREAFNNIQGKSESGFDLNVLAAGKDGSTEPVYLYLLEDKFRKQMIVVGSEDIGIQLKSDLIKSGVSYMVKDDEATEGKINEFLSEGVRMRVEAGKPINQEENLIETLIYAFSTLCELPVNEAGEIDIGSGYTFGKILQLNNSEPSTYTSIFKPRVPGR